MKWMNVIKIIMWPGLVNSCIKNILICPGYKSEKLSWMSCISVCFYLINILKCLYSAYNVHPMLPVFIWNKLHDVSNVMLREIF